MKHNSRPSTILSAMPRLEITHVWTLKYLLFLEKKKDRDYSEREQFKKDPKRQTSRFSMQNEWREEN